MWERNIFSFGICENFHSKKIKWLHSTRDTERERERERERCIYTKQKRRRREGSQGQLDPEIANRVEKFTNA
jgi:hypothetical protein